MYQILFDDKVVRVGFLTREEAEEGVGVMVKEFEKKAMMRKLDANARAEEVESAKREFERNKKAAQEYNKTLPDRFSVYDDDGVAIEEEE